MRKIYFLLLTIVFAAISTTSNAQVTGTKTIGIDYPNIAAAVTALNASGVGAGGATINVPAGYTETVPSNGILLGSTALNATLSASNPLVFQKSGAGANPVLTAFTGGTSTTSDGVFKLAGTDYVTIDGINIIENGANTGAAFMEWGYALVNLNASAPFDGCQNVTIKNCAVRLDRANPNGSIAIYSAHNIATNATALTITAVGDLHSNNKFYSNSISNANEGIFILGFAAVTPFTLYDQNNDVGGSSAATGNTITQMGVTSLFNTFCIYLANQNNANASYNNIDNAAGGGVTSTTQLVGIFTNGTNSTFTANNNNVLLTATNPGAVVVAGISSGNTGNTNIANNTVRIVESLGSATNYGIFLSSTATETVTANTISASNTGGGSGSFYFIYNSANAATATISNNILNNTDISTTGTTAGIYNNSTGVTYNVTNNTITNISRSATSGTHYSIYVGSPTTGNFTGNLIDNISFTAPTSTGTIYGIYDISSGVTINYLNNIVRNMFTPTTGSLFGIREFGTSGAKTIQNNQVYNLGTTPGGAGGASITGISLATGTTDIISNNLVYSLKSTGTTGGTGGAIVGILVSSGTTNNVYKNKVYDLATNSTGGSVYGIQFSGGTTNNVYNNLIGDLRAPFANSTTDLVRGIAVTSTTTSSSTNLYYNTIYLNATSNGANFATSGVFHTTSTTATTSSLTMRNNIIYNNSFANGTGIVAAFRRSSGAASALANYNTASNRNLFFAGTPSATQLIYYDGTSSAQTLAAYQAGVFTAGTVAPRDANSVTELSTPFLSVNGADPTFLHINPSVPTVAESNGAPIATFTDDYDGDARNGSTPDIGADEFNGITVPACSGSPTPGTITGNPNICTGQSTVLTVSGFSAATGIQLQWASSNVAGGPYTNIASATGSSYNTGVIPTGSSVYYIVKVTCSNSATTVNTPEFSVTSNASPTVTVTPGAPAICSNGTGVVLTANGAATYSWSPATGLSATTGSSVTANPSTTTTYTVTGTNAAGCTGTATVTVTVNAAPTILSATATPATICYNGNSQLQSSVGGTPATRFVQSALTGQTYSQLTGAGITVINSDAQLTTGFGGGTQDDGGVVVTLPFTFSYLGNNFTQMSMSTNGWIAAGNWGTIDALNSRTGSNLFTTSIPNNTIAAWFKDMGANFPTSQPGTGPGSMRHGLIGTDVYAFQWDQAVGSSFSITTVNTISFQINIYGPNSVSPGRIEMIYGPTAGTVATAASIGLEDATGGTDHYINALGAGNVTTTSSAWPGNGNGYRFDIAPITYNWTPSTFLNATNISNPLANNVTSTTTYTLNVTNIAGCTSSSNVTVTIDPTQYNVTGGGSYCQSAGTGVVVGLSGSQNNVNYQLVLNGTTNVGSPVAGTGSAISFGLQPAVGTYTVTATNTGSGCTGPMNGSAVVSYLPAPVLSSTNTQPTTCVSNDGAIDLTVGGTSGGPYTYVWSTSGGSGLTPGVEDQTGLTVGTYNVTVTGANGCSSTFSITLIGPGGCSICPTIGSVTSNPSTCANANTTFTANGLVSMGVTYGIQFKYSASPLADPYTSGTIMGTVPNASLTSGGTVATLSAALPAGTYNVYAILSPVPVDPSCRPSATTSIVVNPIPTVNSVSNQTICNNGSTTAVTFSGAVPSTVYNWTNNTPSIGLAASGTGDIASFTATNAGTSPVTATITVTPSYTNAGTTCTGTPTTFTITVNPTPTVNAVANQTRCNGALTAAVTFSGGVTGTVYNWTNNTTSIGLAASGSGNIAAFTATNTGTAPVTATITVTPSYTNGGTTCTGTPSTFTITVNPTPTVNAVSNQTVCNGSPTTAVTFSGAVTGTVYNWTNNTTSIGLAASGSGNIAAFNAINTGTTPVTATITVTPSYTNGSVTCTGTSRTFTITVNPTPTITCPGNIVVNNTTGQCGANVTYPPATATGTPTPTITYSIASGSFFPVGTTTVTATATNSCGTATCTFTVRVNDTQAPVVTCPGNITVNTPVGSCTAVVNYTVTSSDNCSVASTTLVSGLASGSAFPLGTTVNTWRATDASGNTSTCTFTVTVGDGQLPVITAQPATVTTCVGSNATFSVTATNAVSYQWQTYNGTAWVPVAGATSSSYTVSNVTTAMNTNSYRVIVTGTCTTLTSNAATLFVNTLPTVSITSSIPPAILPGQTVDLTANVIPAGGTFQWFKNGTAIAGATSATLSGLTVSDQGVYTVRYTSPAGCVNTSAAVTISGLQSNNMYVYPSPNTGNFNVRYYNSVDEQVTVNVFDQKGSLVVKKQVKAAQPYSTINIQLPAGYAAGTYVVEIRNGQGKLVGAKQILVKLP